MDGYRRSPAVLAANAARRARVRWETPLGRFVSEFTISRLLADLHSAGLPQYQPHAVYRWLSGATRPRPDVATAIVGLSAGRLTLEQVYMQRDALLSPIPRRTRGV